MNKTGIITFFLFISIILNAQPYQIAHSSTYCELLINDGDTTLKITGQGRIPDIITISVIGRIYNTNWSSLGATIKTISIDEGITEIGKQALQRCSTLVIDLPQSLRIIDDQAFQWCEKLKTVNFPANIEKLGESTFYSCTLLDTLFLPENLKFIGKSCFSFCKNLTMVTIPYHIDSLHKNTFFNCSNLSFIHSFNTTPPIVADNSVFLGVNKSACYLKVPTSALMAYKMAPVWQDFLLIGGGLSISATPDDFNNGSVTGLEPKFYNNGDNITIKAVPNNGYKFEAWTVNGNIISTQNPFSFTATKDTAIVAKFSKGNSLKDENLKNLIAIFPNPVNDMLFINTELEITEIAIYDVLGRKLLQKHHAKEININNLNSGIYFLKINTELGSYTKKILKK